MLCYIKRAIAPTLFVLCVLGLPALAILAMNAFPCGKVYKYDLHGGINIQSADTFRKFLEDKEKGDIIKLHVESFGGMVLSMNKIIHYIKNTEATVECVTDSHAASAGAMILLSCNKIIITDNALILFHMVQVCLTEDSTGACIKTGPADPLLHSKTFIDGVEALLVIKHLLTKEEWDAMLKGKDIIIKGKEMMRRLKQGENHGVNTQ